jgi:hypothetical protein
MEHASDKITLFIDKKTLESYAIYSKNLKYFGGGAGGTTSFSNF